MSQLTITWVETYRQALAAGDLAWAIAGAAEGPLPRALAVRLAQAADGCAAHVVRAGGRAGARGRRSELEQARCAALEARFWLRRARLRGCAAGATAERLAAALAAVLDGLVRLDDLQAAGGGVPAAEHAWLIDALGA